MKRSKIMLGLFALLFAGVGAFASITDTQPVYYLDDEADPKSCTKLDVSFNCELGGINCIKSTPAGPRLLHEDLDCEKTLQLESGF